ncbi:putative membrane protein [Opitutaceae bacterium TAV1]|nr:putative membrane protein [Opitutaceae bacterium TAV1]
MSLAADLLKEVPLFKFLSDQERETLGNTLEIVRYPKNSTVFNVGDPGDSFYVICTGNVEVFFKNNTGEQVVLETPRAGEFFGELSMLDGGPRSASVRVVEDLEAVRVSRDRLEAFLQAHPTTAMSFLTAMGRRMRVSAEKLRHTATRNVNEAAADNRTLVQKAADWIAEFAGSITFLVLHVIWFTLWLGLNTVKVPGIPQFDPYPFGFLTLTVSLEAIFLSVFVLLSQNRQAAKDRVRSDVEYDVNLKAELEIMHLHEKVDRMNADVLDRLDKLRRAQPAASPVSRGAD